MQLNFRFKGSLVSFTVNAALIYASQTWQLGKWLEAMIPYLIGAVAVCFFIILYRELKSRPISESSALAAGLENADRRLISEKVKSYYWCKEVSERICEFRKNRCVDAATKATRAVVRFYHGNPEWAKSQTWFEGLLSAAQAEGINIDEQLSNGGSAPPGSP